MPRYRDGIFSPGKPHTKSPNEAAKFRPWADRTNEPKERFGTNVIERMSKGRPRKFKFGGTEDRVTDKRGAQQMEEDNE